MRITYIRVRNFKSIRDLEIKEIENAMILVGKNNTGKTVVIDAIRLVTGNYQIEDRDFMDLGKKIQMDFKVEFNEEDLAVFHSKGVINHYKKYDSWYRDFCNKLPSFQDGELAFHCEIDRAGKIVYTDGIPDELPANDGKKADGTEPQTESMETSAANKQKRHVNRYIKEVFPKTYHIDHSRNIEEIQDDVFRFYDRQSLTDLKENICIFDKARKCNHCFKCIPVFNKKTPEELTLYETARLMEYKLFHMNLNDFAEKLNRYFSANGSGSQEIKYEIDFDPEKMFQIQTKVHNKDRQIVGSINYLSEGLRSIYVLSLLEAYIDEDGTIPCIIMIEDPEIFLHPQLQKTASEILYRLSKKNQVIFSTHSPNMIFNFSSKQIKQVVLDEDYYTVVNENTDVDEILDDLGYTANDLMNVSFVFIVEGKQDGNRLPLLLEKYYREIYDDEGKLQRISIVPTNSCTNIKTYANLKYINKLYLKDQFLMIRDSDGKNPKHLVKQLCSYYSQRAKEDVGNLPHVTPRNVLVLKYYSFENYFLDPKVMTKIGVVRSENDFYNILFKKYKDYLYKLGSVRRMIKTTGIRINTKEDLKANMETIKIYVRGHNLFDIFYGRYHGEAENEILKKYIEVAPRDNFKDILDAIDHFVYFENRQKER